MRVTSTSKSCHALVRYRYRYNDLVTGDQLARLAGISPRAMGRLVNIGVIEPEPGTAGNLFRVGMVRDIRAAARLHRDLAVSWSSMPVVLDLLRRIDELESELRRITRR
jgi:hypothetical protein